MTVRFLFLALLGFFSVPGAAAQAPVNAPVQLVAPVTDAKGNVVETNAPDGKSYPVFRMPDDSPLVRQVYDVLQTTFAHQAIVLDRYARNLLMRESAGRTPPQELTAPAYLLMSQEEGGFARHGFWLADSKNQRQLVLAGYVDLVVGAESVQSGNLEEIFSHELGHQILAELVGKLPAGPARNMHESMTITDEPTAFDEGFAEHFQPLVRDATANPRLREITKGIIPSDLDQFWLSRVDQQLRTDGVKRNLFIHRKALPAAALDPGTDIYRLYRDDETSTAFLNGELRNGQQMMASEGVIATLFYRIVNEPSLREHYREATFYTPFLGSGVSDDKLRQAISPYENVNLKIFFAMRRAAKDIASGKPPMIALVDNYAAAFPDEASAIYKVFLETTRGATTSQELASAFERAAADGNRGDIGAFRSSSPSAFALLKSTVERVARKELALDANLGPQLWLLNADFQIASAVWSSERTLPLTLNLNTASEIDLMTIPGVDLAMARKIISARNAHGFFSSIDDLQTIAAPQLLERFRAMFEQMKKAPAVPRM
jgi:DNA uptake protein ComE-like DNA-binding protein